MNSSSNGIHKKFIWKWKISNFASFENSFVPITNYIRNGFGDLVQEKMGKKIFIPSLFAKEKYKRGFTFFRRFFNESNGKSKANQSIAIRVIRRVVFTCRLNVYMIECDWKLKPFSFIAEFFFFLFGKQLILRHYLFCAYRNSCTYVHTSINSLHRITIALNRNSNCEYVPSSPINSQMVLSDKQNPRAIHIFIIAQWIWTAKRVRDMRCVFATRNMWSDHQKPYSIDKFLSPGLGS